MKYKMKKKLLFKQKESGFVVIAITGRAGELVTAEGRYLIFSGLITTSSQQFSSFPRHMCLMDMMKKDEER